MGQNILARCGCPQRRKISVSMWLILPKPASKVCGYARGVWNLSQSSVTLLVACLTAVVTMLGWFISKALERRQKLADSRRLYIQKQIEEFYGPLYSLIWQIFTANHLKDRVLNECRLSADQTARVHSHFASTYFAPLHARIKEILESKLYLVDGKAMPWSFYEYLSHTMQEDTQRCLWMEEQIDTSAIHGTEFPDGFYTNVDETLQKLMEEYEISVQDLKTGMGSQGIVKPRPKSEKPRTPDDSAPLVA